MTQNPQFEEDFKCSICRDRFKIVLTLFMQGLLAIFFDLMQTSLTISEMLFLAAYKEEVENYTNIEMYNTDE